MPRKSLNLTALLIILIVVYLAACGVIFGALALAGLPLF